MPSTELSGALATRLPASCEVTISFEYDDPSADAALVDAQKYRLAGISGQRVAWIEESVQSEDQGVPGDQHHDVRATFDVPHADEQRAARWLVQQMRTVAPGDDILGVCVNGRWLPADDWI